MRKPKKDKKGFFGEFKEFISRGSVIDLAVGIIIGGAFTAIVTALTGHILTPLINWALAAIVGDKGLESARTLLSAQYQTVDGVQVIDWESSIYIDWGAFISAIINFILIALVLFLIVRAINRAKEAKAKLEAKELEKYYVIPMPTRESVPVIAGFQAVILISTVPVFGALKVTPAWAKPCGRTQIA